jgi:ankyrin repeat protein
MNNDEKDKAESQKKRVFLFKKTRNTPSQDVPRTDDIATRDNVMSKLDKKLLKAAYKHESDKLQPLINEGASVNAIDPRTGATALHYAAAFNDRASIRILIKQENIDYLIKDKEGRLASEHAFVGGADPVVGKLLVIKEQQQHLG